MVLECSGVDSRTIGITILEAGTSEKQTPVIDPAFKPIEFTHIDTSTSVAVLSMSECHLEFDRTTTSITFFNKNNKEIFVTDLNIGFQLYSLTASITTGVYYGLENDAPQLATTSEQTPITGGDQGHAGGMFIWSPAGFSLLADVIEGSAAINGNSSTMSFWRSDSLHHNSIYLSAGTPAELFKSYYTITGFPDLPPYWSLGFIHSKWKQDQSEVLSKIHTYHDRNIPLDGWALDFEWMDWGNDQGEFKWNPIAFPSASTGAFRDSLDALGIHLIGIRKPRIHLETSEGAYAKEHGFFCDSGTDYFSHKKIGLLDYYQPEVRRWFWNSFIDPSHNCYDLGVRSYWNDEAGYKGSLMYLYMQQSQYEGQRAYNNERVFSLNRNYFCGAHRYGYGLWSGDLQSTFDELNYQRPRMLKSIALGSGFWSMDIGGFWGKQDSTPTVAENYYRWMQMGAFVPFYRIHSVDVAEREPWLYGVEADSIAEKFIRLRYELLPYIYAAFWKYHTTGTPPVRPLVFDYPDETATFTEIRAWKFGDDMIVAPITTQGATSVTFYLPAGAWYDYWTDELYTGGREVTISKPKDQIPILIRAGAIIPKRKSGLNSADSSAFSSIEFHIFGSTAASAAYYEDDLRTYDYEKGVYAEIPYVNSTSGSIQTLFINTTQGSYDVPERTGYMIFHLDDTKPKTVTYNGIDVPEVAPDSISAAGHICWCRSGKRIVFKTFSPFKSSSIALLPAADVVQAANSERPAISALANPVTADLMLSISSRTTDRVAVSILDSKGSIVKHVTLDLLSGKQIRSIPISDLTTGSYYLIMDGSAAAILPFIKQ